MTYADMDLTMIDEDVDRRMICADAKKKKNILVAAGVLIAAVLVIAIIVLATKSSSGAASYSTSHIRSCDIQFKNSTLGKYSSAGVSSDASPCASIAVDFLRRGASAADAAVAAMFCVGIINSQSSGLGGGFVATYYSKRETKAYSLDAREVAPKAATRTMYNPQFNPQLQGKKEKWYEKKPSANLKGGLSVAVPGEPRGLYELYQRFGGQMPWEELLEPTIKLCEQGYNLTWYTGGIMYPMRNDFLAEPSMSIYMNPSENRVLHEGETVYRKKLAETLRVLQKNPYALNEGELAQEFVKDLKEFGGIITEEDLRDYRPKWREPVTFYLQNGNYKLHSFPPPGSGLILGLTLNILDEFNLTEASLGPEELFTTQQRVAEAFKFSYARRYQMGDLDEEQTKYLIMELTSETLASTLKAQIHDNVTNQDPRSYGAQMVPDADAGTAHLSLLAPNGDAVAITSSINYGFGAGIRSESTGIIYNNQMADFTTDQDYYKPGQMKMEHNLITPGKRPLSSMSPTIVVDANNNVRLVVGAAGGIKIPSAAAWVTARYLWMGQDVKESIDECRSHHSLIPMTLEYEKGFPKDILDALKEKGHVLEEYRWPSVVIAVAADSDGEVSANSDYRKTGEIGGF